MDQKKRANLMLEILRFQLRLAKDLQYLKVSLPRPLRRSANWSAAESGRSTSGPGARSNQWSWRQTAIRWPGHEEFNQQQCLCEKPGMTPLCHTLQPTLARFLFA